MTMQKPESNNNSMTKIRNGVYITLIAAVFIVGVNTLINAASIEDIQRTNARIEKIADENTRILAEVNLNKNEIAKNTVRINIELEVISKELARLNTMLEKMQP